MTTQTPFSYKDLFVREHLYSFMEGFALLLAALIANHFSTLYALSYSTRTTFVYVGDLLLDNLPILNLNLIVVEGALWVIALSILIVFWNPRRILFILKAVALLMFVRAFFISLTHVGIYPGQINPGPGFFDALYSYFNFQTGYFFSGHTALPFLMALVFWDKPVWRYTYLALSFIFGVSVLFAHIHYSIDVFAAPFMAYGIFAISQKLFQEDYILLLSDTVSS